MEYPVQQILELAYAAKRVNGKYRKETGYHLDDKNFYGNRDLITFTVTNEQFFKGDPLVVTDEDRAALEIAHKHMRRYTLLAMGNLTDFVRDMYADYCKETVKVNSFGRLAYFPYFVENEMAQLDLTKRLKTEFGESKNLDRVEGVIEILTQRFIRDQGKYVYLAAHKNSLVSFWHEKNLDVNGFYNIRSKVKGHGVDRKSNLPVTYINYVKGL